MDESKRKVLERLVSIVGGEVPIDEGSKIVAPRVTIHMDGSDYCGYNGWHAWITFIRTRRQVVNLTLELVRMVPQDDGTVRMYGRWRAVRKGTPVVSAEDKVSVRYRVEDGMIVEIWTTRVNYVVIFGSWIKYKVAWWFVLLHYGIWKSLSHDRGQVKSATGLGEFRTE